VEPVRVAIEADLLAGAPVRVPALEWTETLGRPYRARVEVAVAIPDFDGTLLVGADACVLLSRGEALERRLCGIVTAVTEVAPMRRGGVRLSIELEPALAMLGHRRRSRIFQGKSALDVVREVLEAELGTYGRVIGDELRGTYAVREYCVQYQESDLDFVTRLLEEEGAWFTFDHAGTTEVLVLRDTNDGVPRVSGGEGGRIEYRLTERAPDGQEHVYRARLVGESTATQVTTRQFDWTNVRHDEGDDEESEAAGPTAERYEHGHGFTLTLADYGSRYGSHDAPHRTRVWREAYGAPRLRLRGSSDVIGMTPGLCFELTSHPYLEANGEHLVVTSAHRLVSRDGSPVYESGFEAQPMARPFRLPRVTPRPRIDGVETAFVVGASSEEIDPDEHGRIKVQFHWDRDGQKNEHSSCWIRCAQPWAGASWGFVWTPRIGMEVLVVFEEGDPDRPLVTEAVYDGDHVPPYALPDEKTRSTIKSNSSLGGGGFNEWRFEDKAGSEEVYLHAQKDLDEVVLANHSTHVGADQKNEVEKDQLQEITKNQVETIATWQSLDVGGDRTVEVSNGFEESVAGAELRIVQVGSSESIQGGEKHTVLDSGLMELVTGGVTRTVTGGLEENITGTNVFVATGAVNDTISASMLRRGSSITLDASSQLTMTGTAGIHMTGNGFVSIDSPNWLETTSSHQDNVLNSDASQARKMSIFIRAIELGGAKKDDVNALSFEMVGMKVEMVGASIGTASASISIVGLKQEAKGNDIKNRPLEINKSTFKRKNS
jgi:type VI secretion system secreted protein VgrG